MFISEYISYHKTVNFIWNRNKFRASYVCLMPIEFWKWLYFPCIIVSQNFTCVLSFVICIMKAIAFFSPTFQITHKNVEHVFILHMPLSSSLLLTYLKLQAYFSPPSSRWAVSKDPSSAVPWVAGGHWRSVFSTVIVTQSSCHQHDSTPPFMAFVRLNPSVQKGEESKTHQWDPGQLGSSLQFHRARAPESCCWIREDSGSGKSAMIEMRYHVTWTQMSYLLSICTAYVFQPAHSSNQIQNYLTSSPQMPSMILHWK